jgi:general stress protein YciG
MEVTEVIKKKPRGFALLTVEKRKEIASTGGKKVQALGKAHVFTSETASKAGRKGGLKISKDREYMATIGRKGGLQRKK